MQRLEVSSAVRPLEWSLGVKELITEIITQYELIVFFNMFDI
jgi:hypothetical protein